MYVIECGEVFVVISDMRYCFDVRVLLCVSGVLDVFSVRVLCYI